MNVLMFGWEFPPISSGGLGTACYGLTKGLSKSDVKITFVLPYAGDMKSDFLKLVSANVKVEKIKSPLMPYMTQTEYEKIRGSQPHSIYGSTLFEEVERYTKAAAGIAKKEKFDIIHCHDWMTYGAGIEAKKMSKKPMVVHVHATEFDRTGNHSANPYIYNAEKRGMWFADSVIAVSNFTKDKVVYHYGVNPDKVHVVHNSIDFNEASDNKAPEIRQHKKIVLFLGRITLQKGPDYFLSAAKKALAIDPNILFIIAGSGDMERYVIEKAAELSISDKVLFAGFLKGDDVEKAYKMADLYIMPSVSEPFGLTALEAIKCNTPVIISKQSGVSEVVQHCLKVDFWDVDELANKILAVLRYRQLKNSLQEDASSEIKKFSWDDPAKKCIEIYNNLVGG